MEGISATKGRRVWRNPDIFDVQLLKLVAPCAGLSGPDRIRKNEAVERNLSVSGKTPAEKAVPVRASDNREV